MSTIARRDTEAHGEKPASPSLIKRFKARHKESTHESVHGLVDQAVSVGAGLYSGDAATFLADFDATRFSRIASPDQMIE
ncbi:MAG: hypothetical protein Q9171_004631, partial [Xanthocarpia ochracea]